MSPQERSERKSRDKLTELAVEAELDVVILYAVGDTHGPLSHELRIGLSGAKAYPDEIKTVQTYRSAPIQIYGEFRICGLGNGRRLRAAVEAHLREKGSHVNRSWWRCGGAEFCSLVNTLAADERIKLRSTEEIETLRAEAYARFSPELA